MTVEHTTFKFAPGNQKIVIKKHVDDVKGTVTFDMETHTRMNMSIQMSESLNDVDNHMIPLLVKDFVVVPLVHEAIGFLVDKLHNGEFVIQNGNGRIELIS